MTASPSLSLLVGSAPARYGRLPGPGEIMRKFTRGLLTELLGFAGDKVDITLVSICSYATEQIDTAAGSPLVVGVLQAREWADRALVSLDLGLIHAAVEASMGGGRHAPPPPLVRAELSAIENAFAHRLMTFCARHMAEAFASLTQPTIVVERTETSLRAAVGALSHPVIVEASFHVDFDGAGGALKLLIPQSSLEGPRSKGAALSGAAEDQQWAAALSTVIDDIPIPVSIVVGERLMPLGEAAALSVGQTLRFAGRHPLGVELRANAITVASAQLFEEHDRYMLAFCRSSDAPAVDV